jgi:alkylresorcinol/alkylpyrone synthase
MTRIAAVAPVVPDYCYTQAEITAAVAPMLASDLSHRAVLERVHANSRIATRYTALPLEQYSHLGSFTRTNEIFIEIATELTARALTNALDACGLAPVDVDYVFFTSVTGISAPSVDALLISHLGLRQNVKRIPSYGLGCVAGASGIARVHDYLIGHPDEVGVVLAVELCSLTLQRTDESMANYVASGLFGDGAAAVVMVGDNRAETGPTVVDTRSFVYPNSEGVIGFNVGETGFEIVLTAEVADVIGRHFPTSVASFLADNLLDQSEIDTWFAHPGGPRILEAFADSLRLSDAALALSYESLSRVGNLSSASVLHVLSSGFDQAPGADAVLFAVGPGVSAEFVLLRWPE